MIEAGTYLATVASHKITETKAGNPQVEITFEVETGALPQKITYFGSFSEKAQPYTIKNLLTCGLTGDKVWGPLEIGKKVALVIDDEADDKGKVRTKVKYINSLTSTRPELSQDLARAKLDSLTGAVMAARLKLNVSEELPF